MIATDLGLTLSEMIRELIITTAKNAPRSQQKALGPSEVGDPCVRKLAYKILEWPEVNTSQDPWASIIGTAVHAWMAELFEARDPNGERYKVEQRVTIRETYGGAVLAGSSDLYDRLTGTTWDWKVTGVTSLDKYRRHGPGQQYRVQSHLYSLGQKNAGEQPQRVAICFLPRHHQLRPYVWTEEYREDIALEALARLTSIYALVVELDPESHPENWAKLPTDPDAKCQWCPFFKPGSADLSVGCPGVVKDSGRHGFEGLIA